MITATTATATAITDAEAAIITAHTEGRPEVIPIIARRLLLRRDHLVHILQAAITQAARITAQAADTTGKSLKLSQKAGYGISSAPDFFTLL